MSQGTNIEWSDASWQVTAGCTRVSEGCGGANGGGCYAERMAHRLASNPATKQIYGGLTRSTSRGPRWNGTVRLLPERLETPLRWRKPRRVFVDSMSDLFHPEVPFEFIAAVFGVMAATPQHTYQVLTKRPERAREWFEWLQDQEDAAMGSPSQAAMCGIEAANHCADVDALGLPDTWPLSNVWIGTSCEDQDTADERIPELLQCPAAVRFVSAEPLLAPVNLRPHLPHAFNGEPHCTWCEDCIPDRGDYSNRFWAHTTPENHGPFLDWLIVGGESGPGARPCDVEWIRSVVGQCREAGVPVFVKQLGARPRGVRNAVAKVKGLAAVFHDRKGGEPNEWPADLRVRQFPEAPHG